jgi:hypothetical protein
MRRYKPLIISILFILLLCSFAWANEELCYPPYWGGLLPGESFEKEALKLYGQGLFRDEIDRRVRFYYNKSRTHTLVIFFGTDLFVTDIFIHQGIKFPENKKISDIGKYTSEWFDPFEGFGKWHRLKIGANRSEALRWLGNPHKTISNNEWEYRSKCACELPSGITIYLKSDKIISVRFWASQG